MSIVGLVLNTAITVMGYMGLLYLYKKVITFNNRRLVELVKKEFKGKVTIRLLGLNSESRGLVYYYEVKNKDKSYLARVWKENNEYKVDVEKIGETYKKEVSIKEEKEVVVTTSGECIVY